MPASQPGRPPDLGAPVPIPPSLARVRSDAVWDAQGKGKPRHRTPDSSESTQASGPAHHGGGGGDHSTSHQHHNGTAQAPPPVSSREPPSSLPSPAVSSTRRLGALGIPLPSEDGTDGDDEDAVTPSSTSSSGSLEANPPASPLVPTHDPPEPTYSRGGSTRSGPSTRSGENDGGAFVSEQSFRDIVDELTLQNQRLKARLKRFESARVPTNLRNERLFEVRFFDGLPKQRRREIEGFLTDYVQTLSSTASSGDLLSSSSRINVTGESSNHGHTESTSSLGATLRSLRSSERDLLGKEALLAPVGGPAAAQAERSVTGSGSGSGSGGRRQRRSREKEAVYIEPLGATPSLPLPDPPALLRRPTDIFPPERDVLAAPSFSGAEPRSTMGTGSGMRISDPTSKKRKRAHKSPEAATSPERVPRVRRTASYDGSTSSRSGTPDPERLEFLIVDMLERLFSESLPLDLPEQPQSPPPNPLHSEPHPLPAQSSTNTAYLRAMLESDETQARGGWLYLNLVSTMAALHRLNVSLATVRHALRTKSSLVEVSAEGDKIRWKGPRTKPAPRAQDVAEAQEADFGMGDMEDNSIEATRMQGVEDAERAEEEAAQRRRKVVPAGRSQDRGSSGSSRSSGDVPDSMFDERGGGGAGGGSAGRNGNTVSGSGSGSGRPSKGSTAPTSQYPSHGSKNGSSSQGEKRLMGSGAHAPAPGLEPIVASDRSGEVTAAPQVSSALRHSVDELHVLAAQGGSDSAHVLGSTVQATPKHLVYTPLFVRRNDSGSEKGSNDDESVDSAESGGDEARPSKRRKENGGVVFFANPLFYSDLAGDSGARVQALQERVTDLRAPDAVLGAPSTRAGCTAGSGSALDDAQSRSRSSLTPLSEADSVESRSMKLDGAAERAPWSSNASDDASMSAGSVIDGEAAWDAIEPVDVAPSGPAPPSAQNHDVFQITPYPNLQLSGVSDDVTAADHFTTHVKHLHPSLPPSLDRASLPKRIRPSFASVLPPPLSAHRHHPALVASTCLASHTLHHHPSVCVRFPRHRLRMSSTASDTDGEDGDGGSYARGSASPTSTQIRRLAEAHSGLSGADYLMSLALPLNHWAPELRRVASSDERASEAPRTGESASLITID